MQNQEKENQNGKEKAFYGNRIAGIAWHHSVAGGDDIASIGKG
jgi:hypothetical protein